MAIRPPTDMHCWARFLGNCAGPITKEHLITKSLYGTRVTVESERVPWVEGGSIELPIHALVANILCEEHNNELGRTADAAARHLVMCMRMARDPMRLPGSLVLRPPPTRTVRAVHFGRWLCKTHCNFMVAAGYTPDPDYVRYAFGVRPSRRVYFYFSKLKGESLSIGDAVSSRLRYSQFIVDHHPSVDAFETSLAGIPMLVTVFPATRADGPGEMLDRLAASVGETPLGPYTVKLDWSGDPCV